MGSRVSVVMDPAGAPSVNPKSFANSDDKDFALSAKFSASPSAIEYGNEPQSSVTLRKNMWPPGKVLIVRFLDGNPVQQDLVKECFAKLGVMMKFVGYEGIDRADVTVTFEGEGFQSLIGNTQVSKDKATMKLGAKNWDDSPELRAQILHEGLHMLGFGHEHASPNSPIQWNLDKVYQYYKECHDWDREKTLVNVLRKYPADQVDASEYDPKSIMHYPIDQSLTQDGSCVLNNLELSDLDKKKLKSMYADQSHRGVAEASPPTLPLASASPPPSTLAIALQLVGGQAKLVGFHCPLVLLLVFGAALVCKLQRVGDVEDGVCAF